MNRPRLSVSSWSLHRALGKPAFYGPDSNGKAEGVRRSSAPTAPAALSFLELPARVAAFGIHTLEMCHFHLPSRDSAYLDELRASLNASAIELWSLLIDAGDITHPQEEERERNLGWISEWIDVAARLGAKNARVIAGKAQPSADALKTSLAGMKRLSAHAKAQGVHLMTENWFDLLSTPRQVQWLLDEMEGELGLCLDFGNWGGPTKYDDLAAIFPRAESCHAKCHFSAMSEMDHDDYVRCLELGRRANFVGPYTLIYEGPGVDEWEGLRLEREVVEPYLLR